MSAKEAKLSKLSSNWSDVFQKDLSMFPDILEKKSLDTHNSKCGACNLEKATTAIQLSGQPYSPTTLKSVPYTESLSRVRTDSHGRPNQWHFPTLGIRHL
jgi:hypothetical protein